MATQVPSSRPIGKEQSVIRTVTPKRPIKMLPKKKSSSGSRRSSSGPSAADKAIDTYNKSISEYNQAIERGDFNKAQQVAKSIPTTNLPSNLQADQQQKLAEVQRKIAERNRQAQIEAQKARQEQIQKATAGKKAPRVIVQPDSTVRYVQQRQSMIEESDPRPKTMPAPSTTGGKLLTPGEKEERIIKGIQEEQGIIINPADKGYPDIKLSRRTQQDIKNIQEDIKKVTDPVKEIFRKVEETFIPKYLDEPIYLPEPEDIKEFNELIAESSPARGGFKGSKVTPFLKEQQKEYESDVKQLQDKIKNLEKYERTPELRRLEMQIETIYPVLDRISNIPGDKITQQEVDTFNMLKKQYDSAMDKYNTIYKQYEQDYQGTVQLRDKIVDGLKGTGKQIIKEKEIEVRKGKGDATDIPLASYGLTGSMAAYETSKRVLGVQVIGAGIGAGLSKTAIGTKFLSGVSPILSGVGRPFVQVPVGLGIGAGRAQLAYRRDGDLGYAISEGIGTSAGYLGSVYSKPIIETGVKGVTGLSSAGKKLLNDFIKMDKRGEMYMDTVKGKKSKFDVKYTKQLYEKSDVKQLSDRIKSLPVEEQVYIFRDLYAKAANKKRFLFYAKKVFPKNIIRTGLTQMTTQILKDDLTPIPTQTPASPYAFGGSEYKTTLTTGTIQTTQQTPLTLTGQTPDERVYSLLGISGVKEGTKLSSFSGLSYMPRMSFKEASIQLSDTPQDTSLKSDTVTRLDSGQSTAQSPAQDSTQIPRLTTPTPTPTITSPLLRPRRPRPPSRPTIDRPPIGFPDIDFERGKKKKYQGYHAEYLPEGERKFERINKEPQTIDSALSTMARKVDKFRTTVGRIVQGKEIVVPKSRKKSPIVDTKDRYYKRNKYKFRTYSLFKGEKNQIKSGTFIEKEQYRRDSPLERIPPKRKSFFRL